MAARAAQCDRVKPLDTAETFNENPILRAIFPRGRRPGPVAVAACLFLLTGAGQVSGQVSGDGNQETDQRPEMASPLPRAGEGKKPASPSSGSTPAVAPGAAASSPSASTTSAPTASPVTLTTLPVVMVSGNRDLDLRESLSPGVVSFARPDDVKGEHKSIPDLLDQIPGVYVRSQSGRAHYTTASIRGSAPSQVNIYIDGVPMNLSNEMAADISTLPVSGIERVEVYRGTTPARFSGAPIGGAINIVTKKPEEFVGSISFGKRSFNSEQYATTMHFPLLGGHMLIAMDRDATEGDFEYTDESVKAMNGIEVMDWTQTWMPLWQNSTCGPSAQPCSGPLPEKRKRMANRVDKENTIFKWESQRFLLKFAGTDLDRMLPMALNQGGAAGYGNHLQDMPQYRLTTYNQDRRQVMRKREAIAGWRDSFGPIDTAIHLTWLKNSQSYRNNYLLASAAGSLFHMGDAWNDYNTTRKGLSGDLSWRLNEDGRFAHLVEFHTDYYDEELDTQMSGRPKQSDFLSQFSRKKYNVQIQDMITARPWANLQITPLIRYEKLKGPTVGTYAVPWSNTGNLESRATGSLSLKKNFESGWQLFGNGGTYVRFPNFYEIYGNGFGIVAGTDSVGQTTALQAEQGRNIDVGTGWQGKLSEEIRANFRLTAFQRKTKSTIALFMTPVGGQYVNGGPARYRGIEFEGSVAWGSRYDLQLALTRQSAWFTGDYSYWYFPATLSRPETRFPGERIRVLNIPDIVANARFNMRFLNNALTAYVEANHVGRVHVEQNRYEKPLTTLNVGANWLAAKTGPDKGLRISFGVNDVFNEGPKQMQGGEGAKGIGYVYTDQNNPAKPQYIVPANVSNPRQGRTFYATLNWSY